MAAPLGSPLPFDRPSVNLGRPVVPAVAVSGSAALAPRRRHVSVSIPRGCRVSTTWLTRAHATVDLSIVRDSWGPPVNAGLPLDDVSSPHFVWKNN